MCVHVNSNFYWLVCYLAGKNLLAGFVTLQSNQAEMVKLLHLQILSSAKVQIPHYTTALPCEMTNKVGICCQRYFDEQTL